MQLDSIIISVLYNHFYRMKEKGRNVIPWFQTVAVLSFTIILILALLVLIFLELTHGGNYKLKGNEMPVLISFMVLIVSVFIIIKRYYFNTNKHILYLEEFNLLPISEQKKYKLLVLIPVVSLPFILLFILYLFDKRG